MDTHSPLSSPALPESTGPPSTSPPPAELEELNEAQLREMYENEEIARFLYLFSRYVDEVKDRGAPDAPRTSTPSVDHRGEETCDDNDPGVQTTPQGPSSDKTHISKEVAYKLLLPCLPAPRASYQEFTLNRLRLAVQRIYPATVPYYLPIINRLDRLARWENPKESSAFCAGFWLLWWHDLLAAAFFFNLLLVLLKHRLFPYPSLAELKRHREEVSRGNQLGEQLSQRISAASDPRMRDVWRYAKLLIFPPKGKKTPLKENESHPPPTNPLPREPSDELESTIDSEEVQELKRLVLFLMNEITDFHERIKNLFIWRKPASSWLYCCILVLLVIGALLVPTKYIVKAASGTAGFLYWHVTPVIIALPPKDRLRLPVPLLNVPTDTEYAMELISQRVAAGEEITPSNFTKSRLSQAAPSPSAELSEGGSPRPKHQFNVKSNQPKNTPEGWKRVGSAIGSGKTLLQEGKRLLSNVQMNEPGASSTDVGSSSSTAPTSVPNTHTFPAHHSSSPGLITFTLTTLYFTPLTALRPTLIIAVPNIKGVKKKGILKGMNILWTEVDPEGHRTEKLDKFTWIGSRDELFARIVGANTNIR